MSSRYVWEKYDTKTNYVEKYIGTGTVFHFDGDDVAAAQTYSIDQEMGKFRPSGRTVYFGLYENADCDAYPFAFPDSASDTMYKKAGTANNWVVNDTGSVRIMNGQSFEIYQLDSERIKGSLTGYTSSSNSAQYPSDGLSGNVCLSKRSPLIPPQSPPGSARTACVPFYHRQGAIQAFRQSRRLVCW